MNWNTDTTIVDHLLDKTRRTFALRSVRTVEERQAEQIARQLANEKREAERAAEYQKKNAWRHEPVRDLTWLIQEDVKLRDEACNIQERLARDAAMIAKLTGEKIVRDHLGQPDKDADKAGAEKIEAMRDDAATKLRPRLAELAKLQKANHKAQGELEKERDRRAHS